MEVHVGANLKSVRVDGDGAWSEFEVKGETKRIRTDRVLMAAGRKPVVDGIGLEKLGVAMERGYVAVNEYMETNVPGLYAIGDVTPTAALAHVASHEGIVAVERIAGKNPHPVNYNAIPNCTYCHPQVASVGLTEAQARAAGRSVRTGKFPFTANSKASILGQGEGFVKAVSDAGTGEILGVHIIGVLATNRRVGRGAPLRATAIELAEVVTRARRWRSDHGGNVWNRSPLPFTSDGAAAGVPISLTLPSDRRKEAAEKRKPLELRASHRRSRRATPPTLDLASPRGRPGRPGVLRASTSTRYWRELRTSAIASRATRRRSSSSGTSARAHAPSATSGAGSRSRSIPRSRRAWPTPRGGWASITSS
jgi:hypothetical protein